MVTPLDAALHVPRPSPRRGALALTDALRALGLVLGSTVTATEVSMLAVDVAAGCIVERACVRRRAGYDVAEALDAAGDALLRLLARELARRASSVLQTRPA